MATPINADKERMMDAKAFLAASQIWIPRPIANGDTHKVRKVDRMMCQCCWTSWWADEPELHEDCCPYQFLMTDEQTSEG